MAEKFLKIGLDFHGVINTNPSYFKDLPNMPKRGDTGFI